LPSVSGVVVAVVAGIAWAFLLVRWNVKRKDRGATPQLSDDLAVA